MEYKELRKEIKLHKKTDKLSKNDVILLQQNYVKEHPKCEKCGNEKNLSYDHIIPQSILSSFNIDAIRNFWLENSMTLCHACNQMKSSRLDFSIPDTKKLLLELLNTLTS